MKNLINVSAEKSSLDNSRRNFLKLGGCGLLSTGLILAGCSDDRNMSMTSPAEVFDLGKGDVGVLNYAYALEQLEADFYTKVVNNFYSGISSLEKQVLTDLYHHEVIHRDFFKAAIGAAAPSSLLPTLQFKYTGVDFNSRSSVLATAKALEDTGVAAYNAAAKYISNLDYLLLAGKIVSVEARHAAAIRNLINPLSKDFSGDDVVDSNGLDLAKEPKEVVAIASNFITTKFTWSERGIV